MISRGRLLDASCVPARGERVEELVRFAHVAVELGTGEWLLLPAAVPHRLIRADPGTNWLAVHGRDAKA